MRVGCVKWMDVGGIPESARSSGQGLVAQCLGGQPDAEEDTVVGGSLFNSEDEGPVARAEVGS